MEVTKNLIYVFFVSSTVSQYKIMLGDWGISEDWYNYRIKNILKSN